ncbi:amidohydrolase family protein [Paraherbaspirillum soli]|uniref:Amidohydrolase n=1 Tax=Paraherbaspirillum soli TaxID=631222 RepID=A0ABW0MEQ7_9BURK
MKVFVSLATSVLFFCSPAFAQTPQPSVMTAFVAVNLLPMDTDRILPNQTVLVENGKITAIGASLTIPKNARIIDGHGSAFLSPGLADMHVHSDTADELKVYLANGVTTVLNMGGASAGFMDQVRPKANRGTIAAPHVYAGFVVDGSARYGNFIVTTADEARSLVRLLKTNGYDFIKVYNDLSPVAFQALIEEGRIQHLPVIGHGVTQVGLERQLDAGQLLVAHSEEFFYTTFSHPDKDNEGGSGQTDKAPDRAEIPAAIAFIKRNHAFVTADLITYATIASQWGKPAVAERYLHIPEMRYLSPSGRLRWKAESYPKRQGDLSARVEFLKYFTKQMAQADVSLVAGTDAPTIPGLVPGFSLHDALRTLEDAGLSRFQALSTATRVPGELIHRSAPDAESFGTIKVGNRADLILSAKNPLQDLSALRAPLGVMANGNWYAESELHALLEQVAAKYDGAFIPPIR